MSGLIALDWGTSSLRAFRMDADGAVQEKRERPWGIRHLPPGGFAAALAGTIGDWSDAPLIACGMVGSRQGWQEVPYVDVPAGADDLARHLARADIDAGRVLYLVPGLHHRRGPDVMRGEETQLVGALARMPAAAPASTWILPGTHSKWVTVRDSRIVDFATVMTGEVFAVMRGHSILGVDMEPPGSDDTAFVQGVREARDSGAAGGFSRLFSTRARRLEGRLSAAGSADYLSGLLIGEEYRAMRAEGRFDTRAPLHMIGAEALCRRYRRAAVLFGISVTPAPAAAAARGLWHIAGQAGLSVNPSVSLEH